MTPKAFGIATLVISLLLAAQIVLNTAFSPAGYALWCLNTYILWNWFYLLFTPTVRKYRFLKALTILILPAIWLAIEMALGNVIFGDYPRIQKGLICGLHLSTTLSSLSIFASLIGGLTQIDPLSKLKK